MINDLAERLKVIIKYDIRLEITLLNAVKTINKKISTIFKLLRVK